MLRPTRKPKTLARPRPRILAPLLVVFVQLGCAGTQEPPAPPPPPVDPAAFSGPSRAPAPEVDLDANLSTANVWEDAGGEQQSAPAASAPTAAVADAGSDAQVASKQKRAAK